MKKTRRLMTLLTVLALLLTLAACGETTPTTTEPTTEPTTAPTTVPTEPPMTAEDVYLSMNQAMQTVEASRMYMDFSYSLSYTEGEGENAQTTEVNYGIGMDMIVSTEPFGSYTFVDMLVETNGESFGYDVEIYLLEENGSVVSYTQMFDTWQFTDYEMTTKQYLASGMMESISTDAVWTEGSTPTDMTLDEWTQDLDGKEVYVLRCSFPLEDMAEALASAGLEGVEAPENAVLPIVYYVDASDFTLARVDFNSDYLKTLIADIVAASMLGTETEGVEFDLEISDFVYGFGYGAQEIPTVPQEAYDYIASEGGSGEIEETEPVESNTADLGDGRFTMGCGDEIVLITVPEGWSGEIYYAENVWIYNADQSLIADYYYLTDYTEDDIISYFVQYDVDYLKGMNIAVTTGDGPVIDGYTTKVVISEGESYYYAWREIGDGWLLVYVYDYTGTDDATELLPQMIDLVTPYTAE